MKICDILGVLILIFVVEVSATEVGLPLSVNRAIDNDISYALNTQMRQSELHLLASKNFGGSIVSLTYRNKQYVNNHNNNEDVDYGRQIQSAATYDDMGECFNPTEAGGRYDVRKMHSSSMLLQASVNQGHLHTSTDMAFWMKPGELHKVYGCGGGWSGNTAQNKSVNSGYILNKDVSLIKVGGADLLRYQVEFNSPDVHQSARFVPVSIHLTKDFQNAYQLTEDGDLALINSGAGRFKRPLVLSTADGQHALGVCLPMRTTLSQTLGYGLKVWPNTAVIRIFIMQTQLIAQSMKFNSYLSIGNLQEVKQGLNACMLLVDR